MILNWVIEVSDSQKVKAFYSQHKDNRFVRNRINKNLKKNISDFSREIFWDTMITCLLTTQQRSGPNSAVHKFCCKNPFPLKYDECTSNKCLRDFATNILTEFGGIRRANTIGEEIETNIKWLENDGWQNVSKMYAELKDNENRIAEKTWADFINDNLKGFGPKQSRNLLQTLGLTKYEIPIDSRITKWLNDFGFPITLSAAALGDRHYYNFISKGIQQICEASGIYPCALDAAIFSSYDDEWPEDKLIL